ncbi:hypothetical protein NMK71_08090 [Weeksellaceae bacterium KMM 9713]|uniref:Lipoprotein n=1 Tax=Profundicola chukchiensis TaxID=2961959 RepID=A0A9X4MWV5_9FLAO|nr:hypothetical protein [Profundicola chukchiensis]MDG4946371.1 hypothetical protein [Profundicola chukchiensis]
MKITQKLKTSFLAFGVLGLLVSCSDDDTSDSLSPDQGRLSIAAMATYQPGVADKTSRNGSLELSSFKVNFTEIELEFDDIIDDDNFYDSDDDVELEGPFEMDLLSGTPMEFVNLELPNGRLEEIEFEFDKSTDTESLMHNKSMMMEGSINGTPFIFWHDFEEEIELEFEAGDENSIISHDHNSVVINFDLNAVFNLDSSVDLSTAVDGNGDGLIEISPEDEDGNQDLAEEIKEAIKDQIDLLED